METKMIFYTTHCPLCNTIEAVLKKTGQSYTENTDTEEMLNMGLTHVPAFFNGEKLLTSTKEIMDWAITHDKSNEKEGINHEKQ